jgi:uncharacterized membrane protein
MERILAVVFGNERKANDGMDVLRQLDLEGNITVYAHAVVVASPDGAIVASERDDQGPFALLIGTALGALIGALGGAAGLAIGASAGLVAGAAADGYNAWVGEDFINDVAKALVPNSAAIVAEIEESGTEALDSRMQAIGGTVFRRALADLKHTIHQEHIAALKADLAEMKADHAQAHLERKARLQAKINQLESRLQAQLQRAKERRDAAGSEARAKVDVLQRKATAAEAEAAAKAKETELTNQSQQVG